MTVEEYKIIIMISVGALAVFILIFLAFLFLGRKKTSATESAADKERLLAQRSQQLNQLIKSLDVLMDEVEGAINAALKRAEYKEKRLNELIRQADLRLTKLERTQAKSVIPQAINSVAQVYSKSSLPADEENVEPKADLVKNSSKSKKYEQVTQLISRGLTHEQIAKELKIDKGEIELISNLHKKIS